MVLVLLGLVVHVRSGLRGVVDILDDAVRKTKGHELRRGRQKPTSYHRLVVRGNDGAGFSVDAHLRRDQAGVLPNHRVVDRAILFREWRGKRTGSHGRRTAGNVWYVLLFLFLVE